MTTFEQGHQHNILTLRHVPESVWNETVFEIYHNNKLRRSLFDCHWIHVGSLSDLYCIPIVYLLDIYWRSMQCHWIFIGSVVDLHWIYIGVLCCFSWSRNTSLWHTHKVKLVLKIPTDLFWNFRIQHCVCIRSTCWDIHNKTTHSIIDVISSILLPHTSCFGDGNEYYGPMTS